MISAKLIYGISMHVMCCSFAGNVWVMLYIYEGGAMRMRVL